MNSDKTQTGDHLPTIFQQIPDDFRFVIRFSFVCSCNGKKEEALGCLLCIEYTCYISENNLGKILTFFRIKYYVTDLVLNPTSPFRGTS